MTFTLNGIGTKYYGKRKRSVREKQCESCGRVGKLASYDTTRFFVFFFIPLIPLGRFHILDDCPSCRRHRLIAEKDWRHLTESSLAEATAAFRSQPNLDSACGLMGLLTELNLEEAYRGLAPELEQKAGEDAIYWGVLASTALQFGDEAAADRCYRRSRQYADLPWVRQAWAWLLLQQGRLDEARGQIGPPDVQGENADLVIGMIEGLLAAGRHEEAAIELRNLTVNVPRLAQDKRVKKMLKAAEKNRGTGRKLTKFAPVPPQHQPSSPIGMRPIFKVLGLMILAMAALGGGIAAYQQWTQVDVYVVNGLTEPYAVEVGGQKLRLMPAVPQKLTLPLREKLEVVTQYGEQGSARKSEKTEIELDVDWGEFFSSRTVVLNPDQVALLFKEEALYFPEGSTPPPEGEGNKYELLVGELVYRFTGIDFPFGEFPQTLKLEKGKEEWRSRVVVEALPSAQHLKIVQQELGEKIAEKQLQRYASLVEPDEGTRISWLSVLPAERFAALAATELDRHPPAIAWHRAYQSLVGHVGKEEALVQLYRGHLAAHPDDSGWLYLLARIVSEQEEKVLLERAARAKDVSPWVFHGLAWREYERARFDRALPLSRKSRQLDPVEDAFLAMETDLLVASGATLAALEADRPLEPTIRIALLALARRENEVGAVIEPYLSRLDPRSRRETQKFLELELCYPQGLACYEEKLAATDTPGAKFQLGLLRHDDKLASENGGEGLGAYLLRAAMLPAGPAAQAHKEKAAAQLAQEGNGSGVAAKALRGEGFSREELLDANLDPSAKALVLFLVGREKGDREMLELAGRLNFRPSIFQHLLRRELLLGVKIKAAAG